MGLSAAFIQTVCGFWDYGEDLGYSFHNLPIGTICHAARDCGATSLQRFRASRRTRTSTPR